MASSTTTRKQTEIQSAAVNRVIDKAIGKVLGYLVRSDSEPNIYYQVTWNREEHRYEWPVVSFRTKRYHVPDN